MTAHLYHQISPDQYKKIFERYDLYLERLNDSETEPVSVFDPLKQFQIEELELIRAVSQDLQKKKDEHIYKLQHPEEPKAEEKPENEETEEKK